MRAVRGGRGAGSRASRIAVAVALVVTASVTVLAVEPPRLSAEVSPGTTALISADDEGVVGNDLSFDPSMSADGRFVVFASSASFGELEDPDHTDVFVRDRDADQNGVFDEPDNGRGAPETVTRIVSVGVTQPPLPSMEEIDDGSAFEPGVIPFTVALSGPAGPCGVRVSYTTTAAPPGPLPPGAGQATPESDYDAVSGTLVFPPDSVTPQTINVQIFGDSVAETVEAFGFSASPSFGLSGGAQVANGFIVVPVIGIRQSASVASGGSRVPPDASVVSRVAPSQVPPSEEPADRGSSNPVISANGRYVAFESAAANLIPDQLGVDCDFQTDVFVTDLDPDGNGDITDGAATTSLATPNITLPVEDPSISGDGRYVAFTADLDTSCSDDPAGCRDVRIRDMSSTTVISVPRQPPFVAALGGDRHEPSNPVLSEDGTQLAFRSEVRGSAGEFGSVFVTDVVAVYNRDLARNGVLDESDGDANPNEPVDDVRVQPVSFDDQGDLFIGVSDTPPAISGDGRIVAFDFLREGGRQVHGTDRDSDGNGVFDVESVADTVTSEVVSVNEDGAVGDNESFYPAISTDGRYVAFTTAATNLFGEDVVDDDLSCPDPFDSESDISDVTNCDVIVRDRVGGGPNELASVTEIDEPGVPADDDSFRPALSGNGRFVSFHTGATNLVDAGIDDNDDTDVYARGFEPALDGAPNTLDFGTVLVGDSDVLSATFTHEGFGPLTSDAVVTTGPNAGDFTVLANTCVDETVHRGESCSVSVRYSPTASGTRNATLRVDHDGTTPSTIRLTGGAGPRIATFDPEPDEVVFPEQLGLTTSAPSTLTIRNTGNVPITINGVSLQGANPGDYAIPSPTNSCIGATLPPGGTCAVSITFTPTAPGTRIAVIRFDDTATGAPHLIGVRGTGATPTLTVNPAVVSPGQTTTVTGTKWPASQPMTMAWTDPVTGLPAGFPEPGGGGTPNATGDLTTSMLLFPNTAVGGRLLVGTIGAFTANTPVLVGRGSAQPGDFVLRR